MAYFLQLFQIIWEFNNRLLAIQSIRNFLLSLLISLCILREFLFVILQIFSNGANSFIWLFLKIIIKVQLFIIKNALNKVLV